MNNTDRMFKDDITYGLRQLIQRFIVSNNIDLYRLSDNVIEEEPINAARVRNLIHCYETKQMSFQNLLDFSAIVGFKLHIEIQPHDVSQSSVSADFDVKNGVAVYSTDAPTESKTEVVTPVVRTREEQIVHYPQYADKICKAARFIGRRVVVTNHADTQGDHIPIGTTGVVIGFASEPFDGLIMKFDDTEKPDMVYAEEIENHQE